MIFYENKAKIATNKAHLATIKCKAYVQRMQL